jgi:arabinose-5-phosphate isomerase
MATTSLISVRVPPAIAERLEHLSKTLERSKSWLAAEAIDKMKQHEISHLIVTKEGSYYGILHIHELIKEGLI